MCLPLHRKVNLKTANIAVAKDRYRTTELLLRFLLFILVGPSVHAIGQPAPSLDLIVASQPIVEHSDDIFFDANRGRVYVLGEGFIETWQQKDPDHYQLAGSYPTPAGARTGLFVPEWERLFVAVAHDGARAAEILEFDAR